MFLYRKEHLAVRESAVVRSSPCATIPIPALFCRTQLCGPMPAGSTSLAHDTDRVTDAAREIREALEGKTPQAFGDDTANMSVTLNIEVVRKELFGDDE